MSGSGRYDQKKQPTAPQIDGPEEGGLELEAPGMEAPTPEHARLQGQLGNSAIAAMLMNHPAPGSGGASMEVQAIRQHEEEMEGPAHGGDDDPVESGPLRDVDIAKTRRRRARKIRQKDTDRERFIEPMPDDDLPPEEANFRNRIRMMDAPEGLPAAWTVDAILQPSHDVVASALGQWAIAATRWGGNGLTDRVFSHLIRSRAPILQDPFGRVLIGRSRVGAVATWLLLSGPVLAHAASPVNCALVDYCVELEARRFVAQDVAARSEVPPGQIPSAAQIFLSRIGEPTGVVTPARLPDPALRALAIAIAAVQDLDDPARLVPVLEEPGEPEPDEDDPLGLDAFMESQTGGPRDPRGPVYQAARLAAERMATSVTSSAVQLAGAAVAIHAVANLWSSGAPGKTLGETMVAIDQEVKNTLRLLVEIARATQSRNVPPRGIQTGLKRASKSVMTLRTRGLATLAHVIGGVLPGTPDIAPPPAPPYDPLTEALAEGDEPGAVAWLNEMPGGPDRDIALALLMAHSGTTPRSDAARLMKIRRAIGPGRPMLYAAVGTVLGACLLRCGELREALRLANEQTALGRMRRNGIVVAESSLLAMEVLRLAGEHQALEQRRVAAGQLLYHMGAIGPMTLLARWHPPID